ncbi:MAG: UDP-N-acetylmuramoyl-L-alanyl-D-glutamate--2,6-diaminopimelate ligase [Alphaproteobacteria bacterium]|nr:MAG: UDP-N-acetylmuramoyl-L-alanyl-D-glutamate--2,6-diaminopimelate ligase [Alphaproteobacteria bacterium]
MSKKLLLTDLLSRLPDALLYAWHGIDIEGIFISDITQDSRTVRDGSLFAAIRGNTHNGEIYIAQARAQGAAVILCHPDALPLCEGHPAITCHEPRYLLSLLAAAYYQPQPSNMVAVTGTDGKTSTAEFVRQLWECTGHPALSIGTLGLKSNRILHDMPPLSDNTSPEAVRFYEALSVACNQGIMHAVCEASSHGLHQYRLEGLQVQCAIFTSFSQDHLDYHGTMEAYFAAKAVLFEQILHPRGLAIMCSDEPRIAALAQSLRAKGQRTLTYGTHGDVRIDAITPMPTGQEVVLYYEDQHYSFHLPIYGDFQVYNTIAAMLAVHATTHHHLAELLTHAPHLHTIRGRLELVATTPKGARVFVDYAHTPAALSKALHTLRPYVDGTMTVIFGCGGDRDKTKRPLMGKEARMGADHVIITDDNPRTEDPAAIRTEIHAGCLGALIIPDRREAIDHAIRHGKAGDVILVAGKGHEDYQIIGTRKIHSDDAEIIRDSIGAILIHESS